MCRKETKTMKYIFNENDYRPLQDGETYENKFVILNAEQFKPEYRTALCQLFYAKGGFGCDPAKWGSKVFGNLYDESYQTVREYILGVATEEAIAEWEKLYGMSRDVFMKGD